MDPLLLARMLRGRAKAAWLSTSLARLRRSNARSREPITGDDPVVVSMTTHGARVDHAFYAIECIARGRARPSRFVLWLDDEARLAAPPASLRRLQDRGLEVRGSKNYGPHTKYYPYVASLGAHVLPLVTVDDDVLYPPDLLDVLLATAPRGEREVVCHRARRIALAGPHLAPYTQWMFATDTRPTILNFPTGVGGVLYPPALLDALRDAGEAFHDCCARADDIWLHAVALRNGFRARQVRPTAQECPTVPSTRGARLWPENLTQGGNDTAIAATYTADDIAALVRENERLALIGGDHER